MAVLLSCLDISSRSKDFSPWLARLRSGIGSILVSKNVYAGRRSRLSVLVCAFLFPGDCVSGICVSGVCVFLYVSRCLFFCCFVSLGVCVRFWVSDLRFCF
jgi:hypothetical protein